MKIVILIPQIPKALTLHHNKFGIEINKLTQSLPSTTKLIDYGLHSELRKSGNRIKTVCLTIHVARFYFGLFVLLLLNNLFFLNALSDFVISV